MLIRKCNICGLHLKDVYEYSNYTLPTINNVKIKLDLFAAPDDLIRADLCKPCLRITLGKALLVMQEQIIEGAKE